MQQLELPSLSEIREARERILPHLHPTPIIRWEGRPLLDASDAGAALSLKMELQQASGSFKLRGALCSMMALDEEQRKRGVVAVSAGNHAIAVAHAGKALGIAAEAFMPAGVDPLRVRRCRELGAEVQLKATLAEAFEAAQALATSEGRALIHPFEGKLVTLGTATLGLEIIEELPKLQAVIVPVGGGGLASGVALAVKSVNPACKVIGVEPFGADSMHRSFEKGAPVKLEKVSTIADSLGAPHALPYSFGVCRRYVDRIVRVNDQDIIEAMRLVHRELGINLEPAAASGIAALRGPLSGDLNATQALVLISGTSISEERFNNLINE